MLSQTFRDRAFPRQIWWSAGLSLLLLSSCSADLRSTSADAPMAEQAAPEAMPAPTAGQVQNSLEASEPTDLAGTTVAQTQPQLARKAALTLVVDTIEPSLEQISAIATAQQGNVLSLQDQTPQSFSDRHTAFVQIRVPQNQLDATLQELTNLGTVEQQSITAEDVSNQLVDFQARLRNLRKTEEMLLEIMDRSGSMTDVLQVARELSTIRSSIEQVDAQLKALQNRVTFSTIDIRLEAAIATTPTERALSQQMTETWQQATHSAQEFTVGLMKLGLWLLVYSPYWLLMVAAIALGYRLRHRSTPPSPEESRSDA